MASTIRTEMRVCDKYVEVTASAREDGGFDILVDSDCEALRSFAKNLTVISMDDIMNFETSRINREEVRGNMSMICLAPIAVYQAAWIEAGMMSRRIYSKTGSCEMSMKG